MDSEIGSNEKSFQNELECSICLPVFNEEECLEKFLENLFLHIDFCTKQYNLIFNVIAVDDGSTDSSLQILKSFREHEKRLVLLYSYEPALQTGFSTIKTAKFNLSNEKPSNYEFNISKVKF